MPPLTSSARNHRRENSGRAGCQCTWNIFPLVKYLTTAFDWLDAAKQPWCQRPTSHYETANHNLQYSRFLCTRERFCSRNRYVAVIKSKMAFARPKYAWPTLGQPKVSLLFGSSACSRLQYGNAHRSWKLKTVWIREGIGKRGQSPPPSPDHERLFAWFFHYLRAWHRIVFQPTPLLPPTGWPPFRGRGAAKRGLTL